MHTSSATRNSLKHNPQTDTFERIEPLSEVDHTAEPEKPLTYGERQDIVRRFKVAGAGLGDKNTPYYFIRCAADMAAEARTQIGYVPVRERGAIRDHFRNYPRDTVGQYVIAAIDASVPYAPKAYAVKTVADDDESPF